MAIVTANITAGAYNDSISIVVAAAVSNGTTIVVYRGDYPLGAGNITGGVATIPVTALATGDVIQASVTERGNQAGVPVVVQPSSTVSTGWLDPETVRVTQADGSTTDYTAAEYLDEFGEKVGSVYDPLRSGLSRLPADYDRFPTVELGFDVEITQTAGSTTLRVIPRNSENVLVGWNGATPSSPAALTLTTGATVTVGVQRDDEPGVTLTRSLSVTVLPEASPTPSAGDITAFAWRRTGSESAVLLMVNSAKACETLLVGYTADWMVCTTRDYQYQESFYYPVPGGTYTCQARVIGETNPDHYASFVITF